MEKSRLVKEEKPTVVFHHHLSTLSLFPHSPLWPFPLQLPTASPPPPPLAFIPCFKSRDPFAPPHPFWDSNALSLFIYICAQMSSQLGKTKSELAADSLADRFRNTFNCDGGGDNDVNKPDFRELDLGSPVSPLRTRTAAGLSAATATSSSSSSSSSGSVSGRTSAGTNSNLSRKSDSNPYCHSGEISVESSPLTVRNFKPDGSRSDSGGSHPLIYSGSGSVTSPAVNVLPAGNICPSGRVVKTGMASRSTKSDVLGSGSTNYGHGSIMRGGSASKPGLDTGRVSNSGGLTVGGETGKRMGICSNSDPEELKRMGNDHYKRGNFAQALSLYDKAIAISPATAAYYFNRAAALMGLRRLVDAVRECEEAIRLDPGYVRAHHRLGTLLLR